MSLHPPPTANPRQAIIVALELSSYSAEMQADPPPTSPSFPSTTLKCLSVSASCQAPLVGEHANWLMWLDGDTGPTYHQLCRHTMLKIDRLSWELCSRATCFSPSMLTIVYELSDAGFLLQARSC